MGSAQFWGLRSWRSLQQKSVNSIDPKSNRICCFLSVFSVQLHVQLLCSQLSDRRFAPLSCTTTSDIPFCIPRHTILYRTVIITLPLNTQPINFRNTMLSPIMFLFALSATAICEAAVGVERGPDQEYQPIKSLASAAAKRLLRSDPLALTQERGIPNLDRVLKEIFGALKAELKRNLVKSLQQMIGALPPSRAKQYLDFGSSKSGFKDADDAVTRFLLGHDYILSVAERFDYAHPGREFEAGL